MQLTVFSFLMSVIWSSIIILFIHVFRKKLFFLNGFGLTTVILLYAFSLGRMFLAIEFPFTHEIPVPEIYNRFYQIIRTDCIAIGKHDVRILDIGLCLWILVSVVLIIIFIARYLFAKHTFISHRLIHNDKLVHILSDIQEKFRHKLNVQIFECPDINLPLGTGILKKRILIPVADYSDSDLRYILLHEYMHFRNKDLQILFLSELFTRLFWWNPLVYLLKSDIRQILEIRCDLSVITGLSKEQRVDYLKTIQSCLAQSNKLKTSHAPIVSTQLIRKDLKTEEMIERFKLIAYPVKKNYFWFQVLSIICFMLLLLVSYSFILQPQYQPPKDDVFTDSSIEVAGTLSGYILTKKDGTYAIVDETGFEIPVSKENIGNLISIGFEIREE